MPNMFKELDWAMKQTTWEVYWCWICLVISFDKVVLLIIKKVVDIVAPIFDADDVLHGSWMKRQSFSFNIPRKMFCAHMSCMGEIKEWFYSQLDVLEW